MLAHPSYNLTMVLTFGPGRRLSTWPTTAVSCPTALGTLYSQLTFRLAWCREHSAVMATELLKPRVELSSSPAA